MTGMFGQWMIGFPEYLASIYVLDHLPVTVVSTVNGLCNTNQTSIYRMLGH
jgi:hypothetical protein